ncbi:MAG TPA: hypothetical protein H9804_06740 [Candidatus Mucispirillum faecigallinarum]|uniref:Uncharacterized protein n=1 Tax=Candidatus Mucispirillum faecigallinarum TaxID=2838699 RepID=A0A9D2GUI8_9BACT|nr:hypothetical protein [Candidatus Mucispirillum faecigallinarum]
MIQKFLYVFAVFLHIFLLYGCADEDKMMQVLNSNIISGNNGNEEFIEQIDLNNPFSALGYYKVIFYYNDGAGVIPLSSDCNKVEEYAGYEDVNCIQSINNVEMNGYAKVNLDDAMAYIHIDYKLQMTNEYLKNSINNSSNFSALKGMQYNYIDFNPMPVTSISDTGLNNNEYSVKGFTIIDLFDNITDKDAEYIFELLPDKTLENTITYNGIFGKTKTIIILKKIKELPQGYNMDINTLFPEPVIDDFSNK